MKNKYTKLGFLTAAILSSLFFSAFDVSAQTSKRRQKVRKIRNPPVVAPRIQPVAAQTPEYLNGNQIVLGEIPPASGETGGAENNLPSDTVLPEDKETQIRQLGDRLKTLESEKGKDQKQKQLLMNLDILTRAESRVESLRKQLFEIIEKENVTRSRIEQIQIDSRGEVIDRSVAMMGSLRPEELREQRRKSLEAEKRNLETMLAQIQTNRTALETSVQKADALVEKVRTKLDKEIDDALTDEN